MKREIITGGGVRPGVPGLSVSDVVEKFSVGSRYSEVPSTLKAHEFTL